MLSLSNTAASETALTRREVGESETNGVSRRKILRDYRCVVYSAHMQILDVTDPRFVSAGELGYLLGVRAATVRQWAKAGKIPKLILPNKRFVFDPKAVMAALQGRGKSARLLKRAREGDAADGR